MGKGRSGQKGPGKLVKATGSRKAFLLKPKTSKALTAVKEMESNSVGTSRSVKATRSGGTRYSAGKFPVEVRMIGQ